MAEGQRALVGVLRQVTTAETTRGAAEGDGT